MVPVAVYMVVFGLLLPATHGTVCGYEHCKKCNHGLCTECEYGYYGNRCAEKCQGCWLAGCEQYSGICIQCASGYYSESCDRPCPLNCRVSYDSQRYCNRTTGHCIEGCETSSYWGSQCTINCSSNCYASVCEQADGTCLEGCNDGWFGMTCANTCPEDCSDRKCSVLLGECSEGCKHGFRGRMCNVSCNNCVDEECTFNELLELVNCTKGCKDGWSSDGCNQRCSSKCHNRTCEREGSCKTCPDGYYGDECIYECPQICPKCEKRSDQYRCINEIRYETTQDDIASDDTNAAVKPNVSAVSGHSFSLLCWTYLLTLLTVLL